MTFCDKSSSDYEHSMRHQRPSYGNLRSESIPVNSGVKHLSDKSLQANDPYSSVQSGLMSRRISIAAVIVVLQSAWIWWFWIIPLPNVKALNSGDQVTRGMLLFSNVPGLNPGFQWSKSVLGDSLEELSNVSGLLDRLPIVGYGTLILLAAWGLGRLTLRLIGISADDEWLPGELSIASMAVGLAGWGALTLVLGRLGLLFQSFWLLLVISLVLVAFILARIDYKKSQLIPIKSVVRFVPWPAWPFLVIMILGSMLPTIDFDCIEYHLQGPKEYWEAGRIQYLPHNIYTNMPFGVEMLHTSGMSLAGDWRTGALVGQFLIGLHTFLVAGFMVLMTQRWGRPKIGWWAALFYLTTPWTYRLAAIPYVEGPLCAAMIGSVWAVSRCWNLKTGGSWILVGVMSGWAMSCKYTAILPVVVPCAVVMVVEMIRLKSLKPLVSVVLGGSLIFGPWLVKNFLDTGNPVYPLAWSILGGQDWDALMNAKWGAAHGRKPIEIRLFWANLVEMFGRSDWQSPVFLAFAPLAVLADRHSRKRLGLIALLAAWVYVSWWLFTHRLDRFWLPIQPLLAILAGAGIASLDFNQGMVVWRTMFVIAALFGNGIYALTTMSGLNEWTHPLDKLWKSVPKLLNPTSILVDQSLSPTDKVLLVGQASVFYWEHPILYNTVFNQERIEQIAKGQTSAQVHGRFQEMGITHVLVDWSEIRRYRQPGNYGFTDFVTQEFFDGLVRDGVLVVARPNTTQKVFYQVRP